jgi:hypothetical protein
MPASMNLHTALLRASIVVAAALGGAASAQEGAPATGSIPIGYVFGFEHVRLPDNESMGLVGGTLLFDIDGRWAFGPAVYGAATGQRGGLFVGGVEVQRSWEVGRGWWAIAALYAGGGGGAGAPVGSGLMLRPAVSLYKDVSPSAAVGLSWSSVRFPSGDIHSQQLGVSMAWRSNFLHLSGGSDTAAARRARVAATGLGLERIQATLTDDQFTDGSGRRVGLVGVRGDRSSDVPGLRWGVEAAAAARGNAAGYMEILGTASLGTRLAPESLPTWQLGGRLGLGLGGGGSVPTGGGLLAKASVMTEIGLRPGLTLGIDAGLVRADGPFKARFAQAHLGLALEPGPGGAGGSGSEPVRTEWVAALQHHAALPRTDGSTRSLDTIGMKLNRFVGANVYLSGQAHSAFAGRAGAYSVGLFGAGVATDAPRAAAPWRAGAEVLVGAAGGGGVATGGGAIAQGVVWAGFSTSERSEWRMGIGQIRPLHGQAGRAMAEISWSRSFGMNRP